jgi:hypothetical protein
MVQRSDPVAIGGIVLQKSKVAGRRIFRENKKQKQSPIGMTSVVLPKSPVSLR